MKNQITKISNLTPASFENPNVGLTKEQGKLLELLKERVHSNTPITRDCILDFYLQNVKKSEGYKRHLQKYNHAMQRWEYTGETEVRLWKNEYNIKSQAVQWFKNNLGAVIIKGKILIIPIIEADEK